MSKAFGWSMGLVLLAGCVGVVNEGGAEGIDGTSAEIRNGVANTKPNVVSIRPNRGGPGSGVLVCGRAVLTAGHIANEKVVDAVVEVTLSDGARSWLATRYDNAFANGRPADIGIVLLENSLPYQAGTRLSAAPVNLGPMPMTIAGAGHYVNTATGESIDPGVVRSGIVNFLRVQQDTTMLFAPGSAPGMENQFGCPGDSGGPVFHGDTILGLISGAGPSAATDQARCAGANVMTAAQLGTAANRAWLAARIDAYCRPASLKVSVLDRDSTVAVTFRTGGIAMNALANGTAESLAEYVTTNLLAGDRALLTPNPAAGQRFVAWQGRNCPCSTAVCTITVATAQKYECAAVFEPKPGDDDDDAPPDDGSEGSPVETSPGDAPVDAPADSGGILPSDYPDDGDPENGDDGGDGSLPPPPAPPYDDAPSDAGPEPVWDVLGYCGDGYCTDYELALTTEDGLPCIDCAYLVEPTCLDCVDALPLECADNEEERDGTCAPR